VFSKEYSVHHRGDVLSPEFRFITHHEDESSQQVGQQVVSPEEVDEQVDAHPAHAREPWVVVVKHESFRVDAVL
jgi:hypothetical protein